MVATALILLTLFLIQFVVGAFARLPTFSRAAHLGTGKTFSYVFSLVNSDRDQLASSGLSGGTRVTINPIKTSSLISDVYKVDFLEFRSDNAHTSRRACPSTGHQWNLKSIAPGDVLQQISTAHSFMEGGYRFGHVWFHISIPMLHLPVFACL